MRPQVPEDDGHLFEGNETPDVPDEPPDRWWENRETCENCGRHRHHVIRRLDLKDDRRLLCDECHGCHAGRLT